MAKKSGALRLVFDCRRGNQHFMDPPRLSLFSGAGFSEVQTDEGQELSFASFDVCNAFYQYGVPAWVSEYFCLPKVTAKEIGITHFQGHEVDADAGFFPQVAVAPMGWSWAMALVQKAHENLMAKAGFLDSERGEDFKPFPAMSQGPVFTVYVDNIIVVGLDADKVQQVKERAKVAFAEANIDVHEDENVSMDTTLLGVRQRGSPPRVDLAPLRLARLEGAIKYVLESRSVVTKTEIQKLIGHITFACLLRREMLSCLCSTYYFARECSQQGSKMWETTRRELGVFLSLLPLLGRRLDAPWSSVVYMTDACESGHATVKASAPTDLVSSTGSWHERWRFKAGRYNTNARAREAALSLIPGAAVDEKDRADCVFEHELCVDEIERDPFSLRHPSEFGSPCLEFSRGRLSYVQEVGLDRCWGG